VFRGSVTKIKRQENSKIQETRTKQEPITKIQ